MLNTLHLLSINDVCRLRECAIGNIILFLFFGKMEKKCWSYQVHLTATTPSCPPDYPWDTKKTQISVWTLSLPQKRVPKRSKPKVSNAFSLKQHFLLCLIFCSLTELWKVSSWWQNALYDAWEIRRKGDRTNRDLHTLWHRACTVMAGEDATIEKSRLKISPLM